MTNQYPASEDQEPLDAAEMLALLVNQQRSVERQMASFVPLIMGVWGVAWLVGFGALWLVDGVQGFSVPQPVAGWTFALLLIVAIGVSAWLGIRSARGIRGNSAAAFTGTVYGITWSVGSVAIMVLGAGLAYKGLTPELANYFYPSAFVFFAGIMYLLAGAIWRAVPSVVTGGWMVLVAVAAPFFPAPSHFLFFSIAGGGFFIVASIVMLITTRRMTALGGGVRRDG